ncbi:Uncharacterized protein PECH_008803 [Penicillium ucsense]|uniref:NmrA-like domain-containing protein n=1 Tax=Penicillium ucsense TaxID=2839758 RepID=A0A8J8W4G8_9EURO|nr:Uncharacterized protein PECM_005120 [Penicillium ucsense]KAF7733938.1 Uncharacterized protein PECH_008803 [Penicillium ucsense]
MAFILVTGATGKQGGALIQKLIQKNAPFQILAVTRNPQSAGAQKLLAQSDKIKLVQGDMDRPSELFKNAQAKTNDPIWGVFSVQVVMGQKVPEDVQGKNLVDEALKHGVKHFVYASVDRHGAQSIENPTNIPHFEHKHTIEKHLMEKTRHGQMDWTILRPTAFYDNLTPDFMGRVFATAFKNSLQGKPLQMVGCSDIGTIGAEIFMNAEEYKSQAISLAGDELTFDQFAQIFKDQTGKTIPTTFGFVVSGIMTLVKDFGYMFQWFHDVGFAADIQEVKKIHPGLKDFATWLKTESQFGTK